jgi:hypothetical protein
MSRVTQPVHGSDPGLYGSREGIIGETPQGGAAHEGIIGEATRAQRSCSSPSAADNAPYVK